MTNPIEIARPNALGRRSLLQATLTAAFLARCLTDARAESPIGSVAAVRGDVFKEVRAEHMALAAAAPLFVGDVVGTGRVSRATLRLGADTVVLMGADVLLTIDSFLADAGGEITLQSGPILYDHDGGAAPMRIRSTFGQIAVRGTRFFAGPSAGVFGVFVERGSVEVTTTGGRVIVEAGQGTNIAQIGANPTPAAPWKPERIRAALESVQ
ncbi:MAG TPA: FecR domain-containing protein [Stellaceae bacterium]|nr:FecR domain-containing protein [Stellaceae bacterium]